MMFALITTAIITGSVVGRMRFQLFSYLLAAGCFGLLSDGPYMVWGGGFLDAIGSI